jgi:hypothetical protein
MIKFEEDEIGRACSMNVGEEQRVYIVGRKATGTETTRKIKT